MFPVSVWIYCRLTHGFITFFIILFLLKWLIILPRALGPVVITSEMNGVQLLIISVSIFTWVLMKICQPSLNLSPSLKQYLSKCYYCNKWVQLSGGGEINYCSKVLYSIKESSSWWFFLFLFLNRTIYWCLNLLNRC